MEMTSGKPPAPPPVLVTHTASSVEGVVGIPANTTDSPCTSSALLNIPRVELTAVLNVLVVLPDTENNPELFRCVPVAFTNVSAASVAVLVAVMLGMAAIAGTI